MKALVFDLSRLYRNDIPTPFHCFITCLRCACVFQVGFHNGYKYARYEECPVCGVDAAVISSYIVTTN